NKPNPFQAFTLEESICKHCILKCHPGKSAVFKRAALQRTIENDIGKLGGVKGGTIPNYKGHCIFQQGTVCDGHFRKIGAGKIAAFHLAPGKLSFF
ncbi:MAG: hypothetical protein PHT34_07795, partial [Oscillospiraceae bacterium]|nr:hypothetical protein [Oscillospiraceae bacterium]